MGLDRSDSELLAGDAADYRSFYERYAKLVTAYVGQRVREPDVAFEVVAEVFARALEHRGQYDAKRGPAVAWLLGIAHNEIVRLVRRGRVAEKARRRLGIRREALDDEALDAVERHARVELAGALTALPADQREAVLRRVVNDESYTQIAGRLGCSEQVVRQRVSRGLAAMRRVLEGGT